MVAEAFFYPGQIWRTRGGRTVKITEIVWASATHQQRIGGMFSGDPHRTHWWTADGRWLHNGKSDHDLITTVVSRISIPLPDELVDLCKSLLWRNPDND